MRLLSITRLHFFAAIVSVLFFSCNEKEEFTTEKLEDYSPLVPGKYITYRLDSTVVTNFNAVIEVHKYQVKFVVDALITDNLGRPSYRIYRFIRDSVNATSWTPAQPWTNNGTFFITPLSDQLEVIEDNLRFIKLHLPIKDGFSWKGNKYLPTDPYGPLFTFSIDDNMPDWDFYYDGNPSSFSYRGNTYSNVLTVEEADESLNFPVTIPLAYGSRSRSVEKYSKTIGLVYRQYELLEYQPDPNPGGPHNTYRGFG